MRNICTVNICIQQIYLYIYIYIYSKYLYTMRNIYIIARKKKVHLKISQKSKKIPVPEFLF